MVCDCDDGYEGEVCDTGIVIIPAAAGMGTGAIVGIALLLLLLLCKTPCDIFNFVLLTINNCIPLLTSACVMNSASPAVASVAVQASEEKGHTVNNRG